MPKKMTPDIFVTTRNRFLVGIAMMIAMLSVGGSPVFAASSSGSNPRYASIVIDSGTGKVLSESSADSPRFPASLTKMMTLYMTFEALSQGNLQLNQRLKISQFAASMPRSKLYLPAGGTVSVEDCILGLVSESANDAAVVLAEALGGTESRFATMMTERAHQLGMVNSSFRNASGLPNPSQKTTARDMALLGQALLYHYPQYYPYFSTRSFTYGGTTHGNHNRLMSSYPGMDGFKTGFINASGFNLVASAVRNDRRMIGVVFGGRTTVSRNQHMAQLLDAAFEQAEATNLEKVASIMPYVGVGETRTASRERAGSNAVASRTSGSVKPQMVSAESGGAKVTRRKSQTLVAPTAIGDAEDSVATGRKGRYSIQIGSYSSRSTANSALQSALRQSGSLLADSVAAISPRKTSSGTVYRARLAGLSQETARRACANRKNCLILSP